MSINRLFDNLLFYDPAVGEGEFYTTEGSGDMSLLRKYNGWLGWTHIIPGNFGGNDFTDLLFYDSAAGEGEFYTTDGSGGMSLLQKYAGWRLSWSRIVSGFFCAKLGETQMALNLQVENVVSTTAQSVKDQNGNTSSLALSTDKVGIGTANPAATLDVQGQIRSSGSNGGSLDASNPNNQQANVHLCWSEDVARIRIGGEGAGSRNGLDIQTVSDVSLMRITGEGKVGIGTTNPAAALDVQGQIRSSGGSLSAFNPNNQEANVSLGWSEDVAHIGIRGEGAGSRNGLDIQTVSGRSLMRITYDGNVIVAGDIRSIGWSRLCRGIQY